MEIVNAIDFPVIDKINALGGSAIVVATYIFGEHWILFIAFLILNVIDYITGLIKSRILKNESSSAGLKGVIKKFSYWIMIVISFGMSPVLNEIGEAIGADLSKFTPWIGWFILSSLMINEIRSVLENLVEAGIDVPPFLTSTLKVASVIIKKQESIFDGSLDITHEDDEEYHVEIKTPREELKEKTTVTLKIQTVDKD